MPDNERIYLMALTMTEGLNNATIRALLAHFGTAANVFAVRHRPQEIARGIGGYLPPHIAHSMDEALRRAEQEAQFISEHRIRLYALTDPDYPWRLRECPDPPVAIYYRGCADLNAQKVIGIVGTRRATDYGRRLTEELIQGLAASYPDLLVVSGLAYGIDICAHRFALQKDLPTVGVMAHGMDNLYPAAHRETAVRMIAQGGLLTDYPSETPPMPENFLKRNRLIAALSDAVVVVESSERGGALSTANFAFVYSRDVFAFPGRVGDEHSAGCNRLIQRNKAALINSSHDLIHAMMWDVRFVSKYSSDTQLQLPFEG